MSAYLLEFSVAGMLIGGVLAAVAIGRHMGRKRIKVAQREAEKDEPHLGALQGALLGLLGLLLGFSFSGAHDRYMTRQLYLVQEANAIGTADLRAALLDETHRDEVRGLIKKYLDKRIELQGTDREQVDRIVSESEALQSQIWNAAVQGVEARPSTGLLVLPPINDVIDIHGTRVAASMRHLPVAILVLLLGCALITLWTIGFAAGLGEKRSRVLPTSLALFVGATLWVTLDLDYPRFGLIKVDGTPLKSVVLTPPGSPGVK